MRKLSKFYFRLFRKCAYFCDFPIKYCSKEKVESEEEKAEKEPAAAAQADVAEEAEADRLDRLFLRGRGGPTGLLRKVGISETSIDTTKKKTAHLC